MAAKLLTQLSFLTDRASLELRDAQTIVLKPKKANYHLCMLKDEQWNKVAKNHEVTLVFCNWLYDRKDQKIGEDIWCHKWLEERYQVKFESTTCVSYHEDPETESPYALSRVVEKGL